MHPIETGNIVMILLGVVLLLSGPWLLYSSVSSMVRARRKDPSADIQKFNNGLNIAIGVVFFIAGILFIVNNLRGNPLETVEKVSLHFKSQSETKGLRA